MESFDSVEDEVCTFQSKIFDDATWVAKHVLVTSPVTTSHHSFLPPESLIMSYKLDSRLEGNC